MNLQSNLALCTVWYIFRTLSMIVNPDIFSHIHVPFRQIQPYYGIFWIICFSCFFSCIFRTRNIYITLSRHILAYSERCVTLAYWELCHVQNFVIFKILDTKTWLYYPRHNQNPVYLGIFRDIQEHSIMIVIIRLTFFFTLIWNTFQGNLKTRMLLTTMTSVSVLDWVYLNNTHLWKQH